MTLYFLRDMVARAPGAQEIHVVPDNVATHKTQAVRTTLVEHPEVRLHFTPTYASWLNQIDIRHDNKRQNRFAGAIRIRRIALVPPAYKGRYRSVGGLEIEF
jgi:transposase